MTWDHMEEELEDRTGNAFHHLGTIANEGPTGSAGRIQERYRIAEMKANQHIEDFARTIRHFRKFCSQLIQWFWL